MTMSENDCQEFITDLRESLKMEAEVENLISSRDPYDVVDRPSTLRTVLNLSMSSKHSNCDPKFLHG